MGQIKKILPKPTRDKIVEVFDSRLPEGSLRRNQFANGISVGGAVLVASGAVLDAKEYKRSGMLLRGIGELADDVDGDTAKRLGTAGRAGAIVDSVLDKFKVLVEVGVLWRHTREMTKLESSDRRIRLSAITGKHATNAALNIFATTQGVEVESSLAGKANMWADGLAIGFWGIADAAESPRIKTKANILGNAAFVAGLATGAVSIYGYAQQAFHAGSQPVAVPQEFGDIGDFTFHHL